jgi:hypothetical protein
LTVVKRNVRSAARSARGRGTDRYYDVTRALATVGASLQRGPRRMSAHVLGRIHDTLAQAPAVASAAM